MPNAYNKQVNILKKKKLLHENEDKNMTLIIENKNIINLFDIDIY